MNTGKALAGNDLTAAEAHDAHLKAEWLRRETQSNPLAIWALLMGMPKRELERLQDAFGHHSCMKLAGAIAGQEVDHG